MEKINRILSQEKLQTDSIEALLITKPENVIYILGFKVESDIVILIPNKDLEGGEDKIQVYLNVLEYDQAKENIEADAELSKMTEIVQIPPGKPKFVQRALRKRKMITLGFEEEFISVKRYEEWKKKFKIPGLIGISEVLNKARVIKNEKEIERIRKAAQLGERGFKAIYESIQPGMTEKELAAIAEFEMRKAGSDGTSFDTIVASGTRSAFPHAKTEMKEVENGDLIIVDIGAKYKGYCSDMTRTFILGKIEAPKGDLVNFVNEGQQYTLDQVKPGIKAKDLDKLARDYYINHHKTWGSRFIHSLGHGVGIEVHEKPYLSPISGDELQPNMVVTIEPGLYIPELGGARTEDLIVVRPDGFEMLTPLEKYYY